MDKLNVVLEWSTNTSNTNNDKTEIKTPKVDVYYCFIRLYQTEYKKALTTGSLLARINKIISDPAKNRKKYTHAAMNYQLNDNFVGLNLGVKGMNDIRVETLRTMATDPYHPQDRDKSRFDMFCCKLTKNEYLELKKQLMKIKISNKISYDFMDLLYLSKDIIVEKIKRKLGLSKESASAQDLSQTEMALICSTFVAWILSKVSKKYEKYFSNKNIYKISPNDLTYMPGIKYIYGGYWKEYSMLTRKFVEEHEEFKKFL